MSRKQKLSDLLRAGLAAAANDFVSVGNYYHTDEGVSPLGAEFGPHEAGPLYGCDPIILIFIGKFGTDILKSIGAEHRRSFDDGWERGRVWDREQVSERLTRAVNGGLYDVHARLVDHPRLYEAISKRGFRGPIAFTSVFRAITWMNDVLHLEPLEIADVLEECRV